LLYLEGERFLEERCLFRNLVEPGMTVVDVGANIGYYMILSRELVGERGKVVCFEPSRENLKEIRRNRDKNNFRNVSVLAKGVGDESGTFGLNEGMNATVNEKKGDRLVDMVRLDDFVDEPVDVLKIDVEGFEANVLAGSEISSKNLVPICLSRYTLIYMEIEGTNTYSTL
jgi:FkbM family methyltransferase